MQNLNVLRDARSEKRSHFFGPPCIIQNENIQTWAVQSNDQSWKQFWRVSWRHQLGRHDMTRQWRLERWHRPSVGEDRYQQRVSTPRWDAVKPAAPRPSAEQFVYNNTWYKLPNLHRHLYHRVRLAIKAESRRTKFLRLRVSCTNHT